MNQVLSTTDGSMTLYSEQFGQSYHSVHGAITESKRVFLELGFEYVAQKQSMVRVLEMGFGTGLNAILTWIEAEKKNVFVEYTALEAYPIAPEEVARLNYDAVLGSEKLSALHAAPWEEPVVLGEFFTLTKHRVRLEDFCSQPNAVFFNLIYFDAFSPKTQPELWSEPIFAGLAKIVAPGGVLTTYSSKGSIRRALRSAGFLVEKHPGPPGKWEVVRAILPA